MISAIVHTEELVYVFQWNAYGLMNIDQFTADDWKIVNYFGEMWTNFAKY